LLPVLGPVDLSSKLMIYALYETSWIFYLSFEVAFASRSPESRVVLPSGSVISAKYIPKEVSYIFQKIIIFGKLLRPEPVSPG
jgi:hypothetical protein